MKRITIVEDDKDQRENYADALRRQGYEVETFSNRPEAERAFDKQLPNLAILDIMLEDDHDAGFELCKKIRNLDPNIPVIFLTARDAESDRVSGLRLDAWDYLIKPITLDFLAVRVSSLFRIADAVSNADTAGHNIEKIVYGDLTIDERSMTIFWKNLPLELTLTEFWIVESLVSHPGHVKSYDDLMQVTRQTIVEKNTINGHVRRIRSKFKQVDNNFKCIKNVFGIGYRWNC